ncbi:MAG TPA: hypothetical protein EYH31_12790 [Anaerolineae bacterium]|nr:hypothetical protein [Anaerolineae bacterium]
MITYETLKTKILWIEQELAEVRQGLEQLAAKPEQRWWGSAQWVDKGSWKAWFDEWFQQLGITAQPIGAEKLQKLMLQEGVRPEDKLLSRGIIAMREE